LKYNIIFKFVYVDRMLYIMAAIVW